MRRLASSLRSSVVSPVAPFVRSARACFTQPPNAEAVRSRSRDLRDGLAFVKDQAHGAGLELIRELSPRTLRATLLATHRCHRIRLSWCVDGSGSSPVRVQSSARRGFDHSFRMR